MKKIAHVMVGLVAGAVLAGFAFAMSPNLFVIQDATKLAPQSYKLVLDNSHVRVIDYRLKAGEKEPMHSHPCGVVVYYLTAARMRTTFPNGKTVESFSKAGDVVWRDPVTHFAQNIGDKEVHAILVEPKDACK